MSNEIEITSEEFVDKYLSALTKSPMLFDAPSGNMDGTDDLEVTVRSLKLNINERTLLGKVDAKSHTGRYERLATVSLNVEQFDKLEEAFRKSYSSYQREAILKQWNEL